MPNPLQRLAGARSRHRADEPKAPDERSLLQVLIGAAVGGLIAGGLAALLGSGAVAAVTFGFLLGVLFLWMDLKARGAADDEDPAPPGG